jgi:hypothetical protein
MPQDEIAGRTSGARLGQTKVLNVALCGAVAALVVCINYSAARAGDADVDNQSTTDKVFDTLGLHNPFTPQYGIDYSERSPLVVPPTRDLPPPVSSQAAPVPNWPRDPEVAARKTAKNSDKPTPGPDYQSDSSRPLRPSELNVKSVSAPGIGEQSSASDRGEHKASVLSFDWLKQEDYGTFTGEPPRVSLTDPPPGYQTPSADQPYGISPEKKTYKPPTLSERVEPVR